MTWLDDPQLRNIAWLAASLIVAFACALMATRYARRNNVIDLPGQRRSHATPTPRGGGIGIVIAVLLGLIALPYWDAAVPMAWRLAASIATLAAIGWIDDHRPLSAWLRLLVQFGAVTIWLWPLLRELLLPAQGGMELDTSPSETAGIALLLTFLTLWSINLHNFMDGIDGLLSLQGIFVLGVLAWFGLRTAGSPHPLQIGMWGAAIAGFLPLNFPRARVFMGDVGSGVIGLLVAVAILWQTSQDNVAATTGFVAASAFVIDATCTLLSRMVSGRRWYRAHREHLYQWMTRTGMSHARVVAWYMAWNLFVVAPVLYWINDPARVRQGADNVWAAGLYAGGVALWICGKRWCRRRVRTRRGAALRPGALHASA